jgi:hypothetical protein
VTEAIEQPAKPVDRRDRRVYIWWAVALTLLALLGAFCWAVVVPVCRTCAAVERCHERYLADFSIEDIILTRFPDPAANWTSGALEEVGSLGAPREAVEKLRLYLRLPGRIAPHRQAAVLLLGECGEIALPILSECLADRDDIVRLLAVRALWIGKNRRSVSPLCDALRNDGWQGIRQLAAQALGDIGDPRAADALEAAKEDRVPEVRQAAAEALRKIRAAQVEEQK